MPRDESEGVSQGSKQAAAGAETGFYRPVGQGESAGGSHDGRVPSKFAQYFYYRKAGRILSSLLTPLFVTFCHSLLVAVLTAPAGASKYFIFPNSLHRHFRTNPRACVVRTTFGLQLEVSSPKKAGEVETRRPELFEEVEETFAQH